MEPPSRSLSRDRKPSRERSASPVTAERGRSTSADRGKDKKNTNSQRSPSPNREKVNYKEDWRKVYSVNKKTGKKSIYCCKDFQKGGCTKGDKCEYFHKSKETEKKQNDTLNGVEEKQPE